MQRMMTGAELFGIGGVPRWGPDVPERVYPVGYDARDERFFEGYEPFMISLDRMLEGAK